MAAMFASGATGTQSGRPFRIAVSIRSFEVIIASHQEVSVCPRAPRRGGHYITDPAAALQAQLRIYRSSTSPTARRCDLGRVFWALLLGHAESRSERIVSRDDTAGELLGQPR